MKRKGTVQNTFLFHVHYSVVYLDSDVVAIALLAPMWSDIDLFAAETKYHLNSTKTLKTI